jgi:hypothetical protein
VTLALAAVWVSAAALALAIAARLEPRERWILLAACGVFALSAVASPNSFIHDDFTHFRKVRAALGDARLLLDPWDRPAMMLLYAPAAQLGLVAARLTSIIPAAVALSATMLASRALGQARPWLAAAFLAAQYDFFGQASSTMTELLFAAGFAVAVWGWVARRPWLVAAGLGYLSVARPEGPLYAALGAAALLVRERRLAPALVAVAPFVAYLAIGAVAHADLLWYVRQNPYTDYVSPRLDWRQLGASYFFTAISLGQPAPLLLLEAVGVGVALHRGRDRLTFLLPPLAIAFLLLTFLKIGPHDSWRSSRYLVTIAPALALLASGGHEEATRRFPRVAPAVLLLAAALVGARVLLLWRRPPLEHAAVVVVLTFALAVSLAALLWRLRDRLPAPASLAVLLTLPLVAAPAGAFALHRPTPGDLQAADAASWLAHRGPTLGPVTHDFRGLDAACAARVADPCPLELRRASTIDAAKPPSWFEAPRGAQGPPAKDVRVIVRQFRDGAAVTSAPDGWRETWRSRGERIRGPLLRPRTSPTVTVVWERE